MLHDKEDITLTRQQKGFICNEFGYTTDDEGNLKWNLWEKSKTQKDFANCNETPEWLNYSNFMQNLDTVLTERLSMLLLYEIKSRSPA